MMNDTNVIVPLTKLPALFLLIAFAALLPCGCEQAQSNTGTPVIEAPKVLVDTVVKRDDVITSRYFRGNVEASETVEIRARVKGFLRKIHFQDGMEVKEGQLLFEIEPEPYQARLDGAKARWQGAANTLKEAEDRVRRGRAAGTAISEEDLATRLTQRDVAAAEVAAAKASYDEAKIDLGYTKITSPITGWIGRRLVDEGNLVGTDGNTLLTTIVKRQPIDVYFEVSGPLVDELQQRQFEMRQAIEEQGGNPDAIDLDDMEVTVLAGLSIDEGFPHKGTLNYLDFKIDPSTGTARVRGTFPNKKDLLYPGTDVRIRIPSREKQTAVLVREKGIGKNTLGDFVYLVVDGTGDYAGRKVAKTRQIKADTGELVDGMRIVSEGLEGGETYIVGGVQRARDGMPVDIVEEREKPAKASPEGEPE
ncbi:MAG: efflux RND transporter periplasmic adaptor subunit [Planctomycetota bacterium]|nr:MAG: efflux RND transporter periplasmic adaptor subunit [Planctomycetota bacterium]REJ89293.1 MAG: efflux RND transporter periplasmic adaptor subunit [Planctomycetota bacterium]REK22868.1 MAG: efflux RND transporter periplasmic adaptor subunit [Planctomycetota bacterium]REK37432.1 MAG: efflux RND transporter periplasmic adaptor subunit [Planctomycetota bacterium]